MLDVEWPKLRSNFGSILAQDSICFRIMMRILVLIFALIRLACAPAGLGELLLGDLQGSSRGCKKLTSFAKAALRVPDQILKDLAKIDSHNAERDLQNWASRQLWRQLLPDPYNFNLDVEHSGELHESIHSCLLPHEVFHALYTHGPELFRKLMMGGSEDALVKWWHEAEQIGDGWYTDHPVVAKVSDPRLRIPFGIHGDDAGVHGQEQVLVLTWGPVASSLSTFDSRLVFTMIKVSSILPYNTMQTIYEVFKWSLTALSEGEFPKCNHLNEPFTPRNDRKRVALAGQKLAGGLVGCFAEMRGDWKYLKEALYLRQHYGCLANICHRCNVRKFSENPGMRYTDFRMNAPHRATIFSNGFWMAAYLAGVLVSPLLLIPGFHVTRIIFDVLHCLDLGIYQVAVPSAMKEFTATSAVFPGSTKSQRFLSAFKKYSIWRKNNRVKSYTSKPFKSKVWLKHKYPRISQLTLKGAALRSMVYWVSTVCDDNAVDDHSRLRALLFKSFVQADRICRTAGRHFTPAQHRQFCAALEAALVCYNALAVEAGALKKKNWKLLPKHHAATHYFDLPLNPRRVACNQDEDMVGRMKRIYISCHGATAPNRSLQRYAIVQCLRWFAELHYLRLGIQRAT